MGTLVAWHYPTNLLARLADHTYVTCKNRGAAWGCWGGKTGGKILRQAAGSTKRANAIAEPDERANITCYLVNGVCHQAANRVLLPAGITVRGAKGYWVSEALYGPFGRPRGFLGLCKAPFHKHAGVKGDLAACTRVAGEGEEGKGKGGKEPGGPSGMKSYLKKVSSRYSKIDRQIAADKLDDEEAISFQMDLFELLLELRLGSDLRKSSEGEALMSIRRGVEKRRGELEVDFFHGDLGVREFLDAYNELTVDFQAKVAEVLSEKRYREFFDLPPDEPVVLGDPEQASIAYGSL